MNDNTDDITNQKKRKKRVQRIKKFIIFTIIVCLIIPIVLSIFLMLKVNYLENKLEQYILSEETKNDNTIHSTIAKAQVKPTVTPVQQTAKPEVAKEKKVYLTFEDGPSQCTKEILDVLKKEKVKATFFVVGHEDDFSKMMYKRIVKEGHTLGMHSYSHIYNEIYASPDAFQTDFLKLQKYLLKVTGVKSKFFRFPGGSSTSSLNKPISEYAKRLEDKQITYLDWNVINGDATGKRLGKKQMVQNVMKGVAEFDISIVQMHDSSDKAMTVKSLKPLIENLKSSGYEILPIDENTVSIKHAQ